MTDIRKLVEDAKTRSNPTSELDRFVDAHRDAPQYEVFEALQGLADKIRELEANLETEKEKGKHLLSIEKVQEMMTAYGRDLNREMDVLRECIADIANNMEAADPLHWGFVEDLRKAMKK